MAEHPVKYKVILVEDATTAQSMYKTIKYKCLLLNGPYEGRTIFAYRKKGQGELVFGSEYYGQIGVLEYLGCYRNTLKRSQ